MIHRRAFFKVGVTGAVLLAGATSLSSSLNFEKHPDYSFLDQNDVKNLKALALGILMGTGIQGKELDSVVKGVEQAILGLTPMVQKEIKELLLLFKWRPLRWTTGRNSSWSKASPEEVEELLSSWRNHRLSLFRGAYGALCELINASYYANPVSWDGIGYPGPMDLSE